MPSNLELSWDNWTYQDDPLQHLCCLPSSLTQPLTQLLVLLLQGLVLLHQGLEALWGGQTTATARSSWLWVWALRQHWNYLQNYYYSLNNLKQIAQNGLGGKDLKADPASKQRFWTPCPWVWNMPRTQHLHSPTLSQILCFRDNGGGNAPHLGVEGWGEQAWMGLRDRNFFRRCFLLPLLLPATDFCNHDVFATELNIPWNSNKDDKKREKRNQFVPPSLHSTAQS